MTMPDPTPQPIIKWRTSWNTTIRRVEIERETAAIVWLLTGYDGRRLSPAKREKKITDLHSYHDTWEKARAFLLVRAKRRLEQANKEVKLSQDDIGVLNDLTPPQEKES
jgi:hypothetical protein